MQNLQYKKPEYFNRTTHNAQRTTKHIPHITAKTCKEITKSSKSNFLAAFRFLPKEKTQALIKVYAFFRIADDCVDELETADKKQRALNYWNEELKMTYRGESAHPVMKELKAVIDQYQIPQDYFTGLIKGCKMDITKFRYNTFDELYDYCYHVAGLVGLTCLKIFEYESPTANDMAINLGLAFQLTNIIRDIKSDLELGRIYLPQKDMQKFCYSENELVHKTENQAFFNLMTFYANKAEDYYQKACLEFKKDKDNKLAAVKVMAKIYRAILKKIQRNNYPVLRKRISLNPLEKFFLMIR